MKNTQELVKYKNKILSCIDSADIKKYLSKNFDRLDTHHLISIIGGALRPIEFKLNLFSGLAKISPHMYDEIDSFYDIEPYIELYKSAFEDMQFVGAEKGIFLLNQYDYEYTSEPFPKPVATTPFYTFESAIRYIKMGVNDWLNYDNIESALTYFVIEKWVGNINLEENRAICYLNTEKSGTNILTNAINFIIRLDM